MIKTTCKTTKTSKLTTKTNKLCIKDYLRIKAAKTNLSLQSTIFNSHQTIFIGYLTCYKRPPVNKRPLFAVSLGGLYRQVWLYTFVNAVQLAVLEVTEIAAKSRWVLILGDQFHRFNCINTELALKHSLLY